MDDLAESQQQIRMRWERGTRYYEIYLRPDLWGQWLLTQAWGRIGTPLGQVRHTSCESYQEGCRKVAAIYARREKKGYLPITGI